MPFGGGSSNVDDWDERVDDFLSTAVKERKPIMVHVNPDNPAESVLDRDIRWALVLLFVPFALGFGGVGVGALWFLVRTVRGSPPTARAKGAVRSSATARASSDPRSGLLMMWIFAF